MFAGDEPVAEVLEAARLVPELDVQRDRRPAPVPTRAARRRARSNVELRRLPPGPRLRARPSSDADVVLSLSTERVSVMRTAYEAVYAERAAGGARPPCSCVSSSRIAVLRGRHARRASPPACATAVGRHAELLQAATSARELQEERWREPAPARSCRRLVEGP